MSSDNYFYLPNGKKIFLQDNYGSVKQENLKKNHALVLFSIFNENGDRKLDSSEIKSLFDSLKEFANSDGDNKLSNDELKSFIRKYIKSDYDRSLINPKDVLKLVESIFKKSLQSTKEKKNVKAGSTINKIFPELSILELGNDNKFDYSKLSIEALKKHYPPEKYDIQESSKPAKNGDGELKTLVIINKETGKEVLKRTDNDAVENTFVVEITDEATDEKTKICKYPGEHNDIGIFKNDKYISISNGKLSQASDGNTRYWFNDGVLESQNTDNKLISYNNKGKIVKTEKTEKRRIPYKEYITQHVDISSKIEELIKNGNFEELSELIEKSIGTNDIGFDMDQYYKRTGQELIDDIKNSNLPNDAKEKLLNIICGPFADSEFYDAQKIVENSQIQSKYYGTEKYPTDEYSIEYNGPIIKIYNKTTGETSRINLRILLKDYDLSDKKMLKTALKNLQTYPGEMLENIATEIETIYSLSTKATKHDYDDMREGGHYDDNTITDARLLNAKIIAHEMAHGIDNEAKTSEFFTAKTKFKAIYDSCIRKYESNGNKRFDNQNVNTAQDIGLFGKKIKFKGNNYATYNEKEAFAICVQILYGYEDEMTLFIHDQMPELIDAARDLYLEIRKKPKQERIKT